MALRAGGPWTRAQLRGVLSSLLVRDRDKIEDFRRRFDLFFALADEDQARFAGVEMERALEDLCRLAEGESPPAASPRARSERTRVLPQSARPSFWRQSWWLRGVMILLLCFVLQYVWRHRHYSTTEMLRDVIPSIPEAPSKTVVIQTYRIYEHAPRLRITYISGSHQDAGRVEFLLAIVALANAGCLTWWISRDQAASPEPVDSRARSFFRPGAIGGRPAPRLERAALDHLADSLGYFRSEEQGRDLDARASIDRTIRSGGVPTPVFERRRRGRSVLILEDVDAEPRAWNAVAQELADGLAQRGVPVIHGVFAGVPDRFRTRDRFEHRIEDLEDDRSGLLVLVFSDGKGLGSPASAFVLERLARWPQVAWMQLQERRAWDRTAARPALHGLPVFPADQKGLVRALAGFTTEQAPRRVDAQPETWRGRPSRTVEASLEAHVEEVLGDSLLWAQACVMAVPPIGLGLADRLRERFHPELPPGRIERLIALPGTSLNASGLRFGTDVLAVLRDGFAQRRGPEEQRQVLEFLLEQVQEAEPDEPGGLGRQAWEWRLERTRLEASIRTGPSTGWRRCPEARSGRRSGPTSSALDRYWRSRGTEMPGNGSRP